MLLHWLSVCLSHLSVAYFTVFVPVCESRSKTHAVCECACIAAVSTCLSEV